MNPTALRAAGYCYVNRVIELSSPSLQSGTKVVRYRNKQSAHNETASSRTPTVVSLGFL
jgi:hypothetical protein